MNCNQPANAAECTCSYPGCSRKGRCCECIAYHRRNGEVPGCLFPPEVEKTYDRSAARFAACFKR
ncbi:MAG: DUF6485 family protein [bacterium]